VVTEPSGGGVKLRAAHRRSGDGTDTGTHLVADLRPGTRGSRPSELTRLGNVILFTANDGSTGFELWRSDGTTAGTGLVRDIWPGPTGSGPREFVVMNDVLYFSAFDGAHGYELWRRHGTEQGAWMVKDVLPGGAGSGSDPMYLEPINGVLVFTAYGERQGHGALWLWGSDGTDAGTVPLGNQVFTLAGITTWSPGDFERVADRLWYTHGDRIGATNGNPPDTAWGYDFSSGTDGLAGDLGHAGQFPVLRAHDDDDSGTDPREAGGALLRDIYPGLNGSLPGPFTSVGAHAFLTANEPGCRMSFTNCVPPTSRSFAKARGLGPMTFASISGELLFTANDGIAWIRALAK
jgi:ELWxxDGT repeat protein